jgi:DNA-binding transcriptional LysR family regulator
MELELRHLRTVCAIADAGSVGRAAAVLGFSQPALSTQLRRIERHFGAALFERGSAGVEPTRYGWEVLAQARDVLARADAIGKRPTGGGDAEARPLRLGATNSPILPGLVARMRNGFPELTMNVSSVYSSADIVDLLEKGDLDAAIAVDYPGMDLAHSESVTHRGIVTEPSFLALPAGHRLKNRLEVPLAELADEAWFLTPDDGAGWPGVFYSACRTAGFEPAAVHEFLGDQLQLQSMIADGLGVSFVQATLRPVEGVVVRSVAGTPLWTRYVVAWRRPGLADQIAEAVHRAATASYRDLIARAPHYHGWASRNYKVI